jgi:multidrug transporter EmrE-like cation transporter
LSFKRYALELSVINHQQLIIYEKTVNKEAVIKILEEIAILLELTGENPLKSRAYHIEGLHYTSFGIKSTRKEWLGIALVLSGALMLAADFRFSKGFKLAPVALVAALRETSILFGTVFFVFILKERITWIRGLSIALIVAGAIAIKMS